jgi:hypothetical protein
VQTACFVVGGGSLHRGAFVGIAIVAVLALSFTAAAVDTGLDTATHEIVADDPDGTPPDQSPSAASSSSTGSRVARTSTWSVALVRRYGSNSSSVCRCSSSCSAVASAISPSSRFPERRRSSASRCCLRASLRRRGCCDDGRLHPTPAEHVTGGRLSRSIEEPKYDAGQSGYRRRRDTNVRGYVSFTPGPANA